MYTKLLAAAVVLVVGVALASLFPKDARDAPDGSAPSSGIALRRPEAAASLSTPGGGRDELSRPIGAPGLSENKEGPNALAWTQNQAVATLREPPPLPTQYAALAADESIRTADAQAAGSIHAEQAQAKVIHQVVDGDTLASLAAAFLGDATLGHRISEANGGRLSDPLMVGSELRIPPRSRLTEQIATARPRGAQTRLVPVEAAQVMADAE